MTKKEEYIAKSQMAGSAKRKKLCYNLKDNSVNTNHIKNGAITSDKLHSDIIADLTEVVSDRLIDTMDTRIVSDKFGNGTGVTISQKLLTDTINDIYAKIREINGEPPVGFTMTVTPSYFIGEEGCDIHVKAVSTTGAFTSVAFYIGDTLVPGTAENVYSFEKDIHINETSVIKCKATILGIDYTASKTIKHYTSFFIGAGQDYTDVMDVNHTIPLSGTIRGAYDVTCNEGDRIILVIGDKLRTGFIRADINGVEIPFTSRKITVEGEEYWVFVSENVYREGIYNVDING